MTDDQTSKSAEPTVRMATVDGSTPWADRINKANQEGVVQGIVKGKYIETAAPESLVERPDLNRPEPNVIVDNGVVVKGRRL